MKLSVVTINYNNYSGLRKTIESVVNQTNKDFEYIIIDGGSTDGSVDVIKEYADRIDYWVSEPDRGIYNAMNKGVDVAKGEYCIFMNSGDTFCDFNTVECVLEHNLNSDIICGNTMMPTRHEPPSVITFNTLFSGAICHQCAFIKTVLMKKYRYDEKLKIVADRKFFVQALILDNCSYSAIDVDVVNYDINGFSSKNRFLSDYEYASVLEELIPERVRQDYALQTFGVLHGDTDYEKFFFEVGQRNYRGLIYTISIAVIRAISVFKKSASFVRVFPFMLNSKNKL